MQARCLSIVPGGTEGDVKRQQMLLGGVLVGSARRQPAVIQQIVRAALD